MEIINATMNVNGGNVRGSLEKRVMTIPTKLDDLANVDVSGAQTNDVLMFNGEKWENGAVDISTSATTSAETIEDSAEGNIRALSLVGNGRKSKNRLNVTATTQKISNVDFVVNADKSITVNGTASTQIINVIGEFDANANEQIILSAGVATSVSDTTGLLIRLKGNPSAFNQNLNGVKEKLFTLPQTATYEVYLYTANTKPTNNITFYPMIRNASETNADYEPYGLILSEGKVESGTFIETIQGNLDISVGKAINQTPTENAWRCTIEKTIFLKGGSKLSTGDSNIQIYLGRATTPNGNIVDVLNYASDVTIINDGYYRFVAKKVNGSAILPTEINLKVISSFINASEILNTDIIGVNDIKDELHVYADGSGKLIKRVGKVDLGTLTYNYQDNILFVASASGKANGLYNIISSEYATSTPSTLDTDKTIRGASSSNNIIIRDSAYTSPTALKTALNGKIAVFELATPTETILSSSQVAQLLSLKTFRDTTIISADCEYELSYFVDTEIGQSIADVDVKVDDVIKSNVELTEKVENLTHIDGTTVISSLDSVKMNSMGIYRFAASVSPYEYDITLTAICFGGNLQGNITKTIIATRTSTQETFVNTYNNGDWVGWKKIALS